MGKNISQANLKKAILSLSKSSSRLPSEISKRNQKLKEYSKHICTCSSVVIIAIHKTHGVERMAAVELKLEQYDLRENSLLLRVIEGAPCPLPRNIAMSLRKFLRDHESDSEVRDILRKSIADCERWELPRLMTLIEDDVAKRDALWHCTISAATRGIFRLTDSRYPDGSSMAIVGFNSRFPNRPLNGARASMKLVEQPNQALLDKPFLDDFNSFSERNDCFLKKLLSTKAEVNAACDLIFSDYETTKDSINAAADQGLPVLDDKPLNRMIRRPLGKWSLVRLGRRIAKLSPEMQLRIYASLSREFNYALAQPLGHNLTGIPLLLTNAEQATRPT